MSSKYDIESVKERIQQGLYFENKKELVYSNNIIN